MTIEIPRALFLYGKYHMPWLLNIIIPFYCIQFLDNFSDGVHGFLFVYPLANPRFTQEEKAAFEELKKVSF